MLVLNLTPEPFWLDLVGGVALEVEPIASWMVEAARELRSQAFPGKATTIVERNQRYARFLEELAVLAIRDWRGVGDANGQPVAVSEAGIRAILRLPQLAEAFGLLYYGRTLLLDAEKNVSAPAPSGSGAAGSLTAGNVGAPASPAPTDDPAATASFAPAVPTPR